MRAGDLAPDDADLGATDLLLGLVDVRNLLAKVEAVLFCSSESGMQSQHRILATYLAASVLSTPSILIRLVDGWVTCRERW